MGATWAAMQPRGSWTRVRNGRWAPSLPSRWAPGTGRLLLLTLGLGLAGAQQAAEEVPVQPGFDARKVTVPLGPRLGLGPRRGASVARRGHCGGSGQGEQRGKERKESRLDLSRPFLALHFIQSVPLSSCPFLPGGINYTILLSPILVA